MFHSKGKIKYSIDRDGHKVVVYIDPGIVHFYYALIPKYYYVNRQREFPHITVVRFFERIDKKFWKKYDGKEIDFSYSTSIMFDGKYWTLPCWSDEIGNIREELGLPFYRGNYNHYHITLGNNK